MPDKGEETFKMRSPFVWLSTHKALVFLVLLALAIRVLAVLVHPMIQWDETAYVRMAENLARGNGLLDISGNTKVHFSPLLPLFIAGAAMVLRNYVLSAYVVVTVFGSLILVPAYLLGKELFSRKTGLMTAALISVTPLFVYYSSQVYSESVYVFFLLFGIVFGLRMLRGGRILNGILAGASLGVAYLAQPSGFFYLVTFVALAILVAIYQGAWRQLAKTLPLFLIFSMIFAVPYILYLHAETGRWAYSAKRAGDTYGTTNNIRISTIDWDKDLLSLTNDNRQVKELTLPSHEDPAFTLLKHPVQGIKNFIRESHVFYSQVLSEVIPLWLLPLLGLGLFARGWTRWRGIGVAFLLTMMLPVLVILAMYAHKRFFMPFVPLVMIWVGEGWRRLENWGAETATLNLGEPLHPKVKRWLPWVIGAIVLLPPLVLSAATVAKESYPVGYKEAGQHIKQIASTGPRIMSREFSSAYYSGGTAVPLPYSSYDRTTEYARNNNVDFLVINKQELETSRPTLTILLGGASLHPEWKLVDRIRPGTAQETLIFQLQRAS